MVIGFAWGQLWDESPRHASRLSHFFCNITDLSEINKIKTWSFGDQSEFYISHFSTLFAVRENISKRIQDLLIPYYRLNAQKINTLENEHNINKVDFSPKLNLLSKMLSLQKQNNIKGIYIAMPVKQKYKVHQNLIDLLLENSMIYTDAREIENILPEHYEDAMHLNSKGEKLFSNYISNKLFNEILTN